MRGLGDPMFQNHRRETAAQKNRVDTAPPSAPFVILLAVALGGTAYSIWHGHWPIVVLHAVTVAIAIWGLRLPYRRATNPRRPLTTARAADSPSGMHPQPSPQATGSLVHAGSLPHEAAPRTTTEARGQLPVVGSFAITGRIGRTATGPAGRLTVVLPAATEVTAASVVDALLTIGHQVLDDHRLTHRPLPEVDVTAVDRAEKPPTTALASGFTVHITNDLSTRRSDITVEAHHLLGTGDGALLIAATLLAGAEHLLDHPDHPLHHRTRPGGEPAQQDARTPPRSGEPAGHR